MNEAQSDIPKEKTIKTRKQKALCIVRELAVTAFIVVLVGLAIDYYRLSQRDASFISEAEVHQLSQQLDKQGLADFKAGKPMLVYVWATWCGVCKLTSSAVDNMASSGQLVSTVALKSGAETIVHQYMQKHGYSFSVFNDMQGRLSDSLGVKGTPSFLIIDDQGEILYYSMGVNTEVGLRAKLAFFNRQ